MTAEQRMSGRVLGVDYGRKRIGLALSDASGVLASPLRKIDGTGDLSQDAARVLAVAEEEEAAGILVGLPIHMDGKESEQSKLTRAFASKLAGLTALPVLMWDERLSSKTADEYLAEAQLTRKKTKARRDAVAAQVILQSYLDHDDLGSIQS